MYVVKAAGERSRARGSIRHRRPVASMVDTTHASVGIALVQVMILLATAFVAVTVGLPQVLELAASAYR